MAYLKHTFNATVGIDWQFLIRVVKYSFQFSHPVATLLKKFHYTGMNLFSAEYNKRINMFEQGVTRIRNKNNNFFENTRNKNSIYDLSDIKSYFSVDFNSDTPSIRFKTSDALPPAIKNDLIELFNRVWIP